MTRGPVHARSVEQRQLDVIEGCSSRQQVEALKHEADLPVADLGELIAREARDVPLLKEVPPASGPIEAAEDMHERRLA